MKFKQTRSFINKANNQNNNSYDINNIIPNKEVNPASLTYYSSFNFKPSKLSKKNMKENETINDFYNYGEYLTQELKMSNDTNIEILDKYIKLKSELKIKENEIKELENKLKLLNNQEINIDKSNQELIKNISSVQNIFNNNKLSAQNSISELENEVNLDKNKLNELNSMNLNLLNIQKEYGKEIYRLKNAFNEFDNDEMINKINENGEDIFNDENIMKKIETLNNKKSKLQNEILQLQKEGEISDLITNQENYSLDDIWTINSNNYFNYINHILL